MDRLIALIIAFSVPYFFGTDVAIWFVITLIAFHVAYRMRYGYWME